MNVLAYVFLADGFEEVEALTPVDVLRRAGFDVVLVSITQSLQVVGARGIIVVADVCIEQIEYEDAQLIILPGGMPGAQNLADSQELQDVILYHAKNKTCIAAICAAPFILGDLGLLQGHKATCYPGYEERLVGAELIKSPVVVSQNIITANGVGAALEFSFAIAASFIGNEKAQELATKMMVRL